MRDSLACDEHSSALSNRRNGNANDSRILILVCGVTAVQNLAEHRTKSSSQLRPDQNCQSLDNEDPITQGQRKAARVAFADKGTAKGPG